MKKQLLIITFILTAFVSSTSLVAQVTANQPSDLEMCGENDFATFDLTITEPEVIGGQDPTDLTISFYVTQADADNNSTPIIPPNNFVNITNPQTIYVRLEKISTGEFDTTFFNITVVSSPTIMVPTPLEMCDDDADGFAAFILNDKDNEISGGDPDIELTYHLTQIDAEIGVNALASPFLNSVPFSQTVFVRAESVVSGCTSFTTLVLIVQLPPDAENILDLEAVDTDGNGFEFFDLTSKIPEILNGQTNVNVTFYETAADANNDINVIITPAAYLNISNPQTIYTRLENTGFCFAVGEFDLVLVDVIIDEDPDDLYINEGDNDGLAIFDLTINEPQMLGDQDPLIVLFTYHVTLNDATGGINNISTPSAYQNLTNPQSIHVRLTNSNTGSYVLNNFNIETDENLSLENNLINNLNLYPNPTTGFVNLQSDYFLNTVEVFVYNIQGQVLVSENRSPNNTVIIIEMSKLLSGIYFVKVVSGENSVIKRVVKK